MEILYFSPRMYDEIKERVGYEPIYLRFHDIDVALAEDPSLYGYSLHTEGDLAVVLGNLVIDTLLKI